MKDAIKHRRETGSFLKSEVVECPKCGGFLARDFLFDQRESCRQWLLALKCVNCGYRYFNKGVFYASPSPMRVYRIGPRFNPRVRFLQG